MNMQALREFFNAQAPLTAKLGTVDCVSFVTQAVYIGWGRDYRDVLQYDSRRSAVNRLRELGGLKGACTYAMGPRHFVAALKPGDVIWFDAPSPTLGLLMYGYVAVKQGHAINRFEIVSQMTGWHTEKGVN